MALDKVLLGRLLQLNEPWTVRDFRFDPDARKLDAWIGVEPPRGWFARVRRQPAEGPERVWRHTDLAGWRCHVHVQAPVGADQSALPWAGTVDMPFSQALSKHVFALFNEGVPLNGICSITGIPLPFFSYGGSFLLALFLGLGLAFRAAAEARARSHGQAAVPIHVTE